MIWFALTMAAVAAPAVALLPTPLEHAHICWVQDVRATGDGVAVDFREGQRVGRHRGDEWVNFIIDGSAKVETIDDAKIHHVPSVQALSGDQLQVSGIPEDGCSMAVVHRDGAIGIQAEAYTYLQGLPGVHSSEFIPARFIAPAREAPK